jgi:hypothetical protein
LLPLIRTWLPSEKIVLNDRKQATQVDRNKLCGLAHD